MELITQETIRQVFDWAYESSFIGFTGHDSTVDLAVSCAMEKCPANVIARFPF